MSSQQTTPAEWASAMSERHLVQTPEQVAVTFELAGIGSRFLAMLVDTAIQGVAFALMIAVFVVMNLSLGLSRFPLAPSLFLAGTVVVAFFLLYGYFATFEILWHGQTPGKRAVGIRVMKETGRPLSAVETIGRNLLRIVDQLPGCYAIGMLCVLVTRQNKRLGDMVAGSVVVRESLAPGPIPGFTVAAEPGMGIPPMGVERLSTEDLVLLEAFLQRRHGLEPGVRAWMAGDVLRRFNGKLSVDAAWELTPEQVLEAAIYQRRLLAG